MATINFFNQGRLKETENSSWYMYYIEVAKILYEDVKELLNGEKKESFVRTFESLTLIIFAPLPFLI